MKIILEAAGQTDLGRVRKGNEDALLIRERVGAESTARYQGVVDERGVILAVSDGMGGAPAGEVASAIALDTLPDRLAEHLRTLSPADALRRSVEDADAAVRADGERTSAHRGMGATLTAVLILGRHAFVAEVGDSRAYLVRGDHIDQVTRDQSYVQSLLDAHAITPEQAAASPRRNVILQAVGLDPALSVATTQIELRHADHLVLCTDGLWGKISDAGIRDLLRSTQSLDKACAAMVRAANDAGGEDNITVVCARLEGDLPAASADEDPRSTITALSEFHGRVS